MDLRFAEGPSARRARAGPRIGSETTTGLEAAAGEDRWPIDQTRPLLLAALGRQSSDEEAFPSMIRRIEAVPSPVG